MGFLLFLVILVAAWQGCYWIGVDLLGLWKPYAMPSPVGVAQSFLQLCEDGELFQATANSLLRGISGYVIAVMIGVILGLLDLAQCLLGALFDFVVWAFHAGHFICSGDGRRFQYCHFRGQCH